MLITASAKYKAGQISKEQYIQVALQVSQVADYFNKNKDQGTLVGAASLANNNTAESTSSSSMGNSASNESIQVKEVIDPITKKVITCHPSSVEQGCVPGKYRSTKGAGGYYDIPNPIVTVKKMHVYLVDGANSGTNIEWNVVAEQNIKCELKDDYAKSVIKTFGAGSGSFQTPTIINSKRSPEAIYNIICTYPSGQFSFELAQIYLVNEGSDWLSK